MLWIALLLLVVISAAYLGGTRRRSGPPLDPRSTDPDGTRGLVLVLERFGTDVDLSTGVPAEGVEVALLLDDRLTTEAADDVERWIDRGGTLIVADSNSAWTPETTSPASETVSGSCDDPALGQVRELAPGTTHRLYRTSEFARACFRTGEGAFVVLEEFGGGRLISIGGPSVFTNEYLDEADNAVLAVALMGGEDRSVSILSPSAVGSGDKSIGDLIASPVWAMLAQFLVAFGVVVWWRSRRLGRPVIESQPVTIAGSELTRAVGRMLANNRHPGRAAAILRDRARRDLGPGLGLSLDAPAADVIAALERATTLTEGEIRTATISSVETDQDLVDVAHLLARIREEILHGHPIK